MAQTTTFDPTGFFRFDLRRGAVHARGGDRVIVLSEGVLAPLVTVAVNNNDLTSLRHLGLQLGRLAATAVEGSVQDRPAEEVFGLAGSILSVFGWGRLEIERWGLALVARLEEMPTLDADQLAAAALLGGVLSLLADREVACVPVEREGAFLIVDPTVADLVWKWSRSGSSVHDMVQRLEPSGAAGEGG
ncbi:MAG: hypothetical protein ACFCGT_26630 [Sandaracinaceae bacterium]